MNSKMKLSIIIPCYNVEKYVSKTIESVLRQDFDDYEIILIDDGSTDNTLQILHEYSNKNRKVKVYSKTNGGVSSARNYGLLKAQNDYVIFLDSDDYLEKGLFRFADIIFKNNMVEMFTFSYDIVDDFKKIKSAKSCCKFNGKKIKHNKMIELLLRKKIAIHICSIIFNKHFLLANNCLFDERYKYAEDWDFILNVLSKKPQILYSTNVFFHYYQRENSAMRSIINRTDYNIYEKFTSYVDSDNYYNLTNYINVVYIANARRFSKNLLNCKFESLISLKNFGERLPKIKFNFDKYIIMSLIMKPYYRYIINKFFIKRMKNDT